MKFYELNDSNYLLFAIKNYENPQAVTEDDFYDDLKRIKYIKRLLKRYKNSGELRTHLILNHFIVLFNVFGDAGVPLLFFKLDKELWSCTKSFSIHRFPQILVFRILYNNPLSNICSTVLPQT